MLNLTVQGLNNKTVSVIDIINNTAVGQFNNNETTSVGYTNLIIQIRDNASLSLPGLANSAQKFNNDYAFWLAFILLALLIYAYCWWVKYKK